MVVMNCSRAIQRTRGNSYRRIRKLIEVYRSLDDAVDIVQSAAGTICGESYSTGLEEQERDIFILNIHQKTMWLDRLHTSSTHSGSPPPNPVRPGYSSPVRRASNLAQGSGPATQRPGFTPRSSSLSLTPNEATIAQRSQMTPRPPDTEDNFPDPLLVVQKLLGASDLPQHLELSSTSASQDRKHAGDFEEEIADENFDFGGLNLRHYALQRRDSLVVDDEVQKQSFEDCMYIVRHHSHILANTIEDEAEKQKFEELHRSIRACDDVLESVEANLTSFQNDLATVSAEIETLQGRSALLNQKYENRRQVESVLGPVVEEISLSPAVVKKIMDGPIDDGWVRALGEVEKRSKAMDVKVKEHQRIRGVMDLKPLLDDLIAKVIFTGFP